MRVATRLGSLRRRDERGREGARVGLVGGTFDPRFPISAFLFLLVLGVGFHPPLLAQATETIQEIDLQGLDRINEGEVEAQLGIRVGDPYDPNVLDREYQRLVDTGQYRWIEPWTVTQVPGGVKLTLVLREKQLISEIRFDGARRIESTQLLSKLRTKVGGLLDQLDLKYDTYEIEQFYRSKGFLFVEVKQLTQIVEKSGRANESPKTVLVFQINEGPRVSIAAIDFRGNESFSDAELRSEMQTKKRSFFLGFPNAGRFDEETFFNDLTQGISAFYRSRGFFDVVVIPEDFSFSRDRDRLFLGVRVREGSRYKVADVQIEILGSGVYPKSVLQDKLRIKPGQFFSGEKVLEDQRAIELLYSDKAYIQARVQFVPILSASGSEVTVLYRIREGEKSYIEEVEIRGNLETKDKVIRRELQFYPGEEFNGSKIRESYSNLYRTNYFESVNIFDEPGSTPSQKNVVVDVKEGSTGQFIFGFGVASSRGLIGNISLRKNNFDIADPPEDLFDLPGAFTGGGQTLAIEASPGSQFSRYRLVFREPYLFDSDTSLGIRLFNTDFFREEYRDDRIGAEISLGQRFTDYLRGEVTYRFEVVDIRDIDADAPPDVFRVEGTTRISSVRLDASYDRRIFRFVLGPVDGWVVGSSYTYSGGPLGAELDQSKASVYFNVYRTLFTDPDGESGRHILAFRNEFSWGEPHHNTDEIPIYERFYLGGPRSLRGFRFQGVGPFFEREPLGGTARQSGSLQYSFPIYQDLFRGQFFADYGNLSTDLDAFDVDEYRLSLGGGILINLNLLGQPIPIALSYGVPVREEEQDRVRNFQFDIGIGF